MSEKKNVFSGFRNLLGGRPNKQASLATSVSYENELKKAEEILRDCTQEHVTQYFSGQAKRHMVAIRTAIEFGWSNQVGEHLEALRKVREEIEFTAYLHELKLCSVSLKTKEGRREKAKSSSDSSRHLLSIPFSDRYQMLLIFALCKDIGMEFPHLRIIADMETQYDFFRPVLIINGRELTFESNDCAAWFKLARNSKGAYRLTMEPKWATDSRLPVSSYEFSERVSIPFGLSSAIRPGAIMMPDVVRIQERQEEKDDVLPAMRGILMVAASLGMKEFIEGQTTEFIKENIERMLQRNGIPGRFLGRRDEVAMARFPLTKEGRFLPLLPELERMRARIPAEIFELLAKIKPNMLQEVAHDIVLDVARSPILYYQKNAKGYKDIYVPLLQFVLVVGPWIYKLESFLSVSQTYALAEVLP